MNNIFINLKRNKKEFILFTGIFVIGALIRIAFGLYKPTQDLLWYVDPYKIGNYIQVTRLGIPKEILFLPLKIFNGLEYRIIFLAILLSFLNTFSLYKLRKNKNNNLTVFIGLIAILNIFHVKIDMHLVRQQVSIYFFVISISESKLNIQSLIYAVLAILYHEVTLLLYGAFTIAFQINRYFLKNLSKNLFIASLISNIFLYLSISDVSIIFMIIISTVNKFVKKEFEKSYIINSFYIFQLFLTFFYLDLKLNKYSIFTAVALERFIGFGVSYGILLIIGDGVIKKNGNLFKKFILISFLFSYFLVSVF